MAKIGAPKQILAGRSAAEVRRKLGVSKRTLYSWKAEYAGISVGEPLLCHMAQAKTTVHGIRKGLVTRRTESCSHHGPRVDAGVLRGVVSPCPRLGICP